MNRDGLEENVVLEVLETVLIKSKIVNMFNLNKTDEVFNQGLDGVAYRVKPNIYKIRAFELYGEKEEEKFFRIYHARDINENLLNTLHSIPGIVRKTQQTVDYRVSFYEELATKITDVLSSAEIIKESKATSRMARASKFEGLELPDVDVSQDEVIGRIFTWREIIAIYEDNSEDNTLKSILSQKGVYIQRSEDGKSRYIGSAYSEGGGILGRWMAHLNSLGDAQHLNLFVLEYGYNCIVFSVLEFVDGTTSEIIQKESTWKRTLGTVNHGPYNGIQLNNN